MSILHLTGMGYPGRDHWPGAASFADNISARPTDTLAVLESPSRVRDVDPVPGEYYPAIAVDGCSKSSSHAAAPVRLPFVEGWWGCFSNDSPVLRRDVRDVEGLPDPWWPTPAADKPVR